MITTIVIFSIIVYILITFFSYGLLSSVFWRTWEHNARVFMAIIWPATLVSLLAVFVMCVLTEIILSLHVYFPFNRLIRLGEKISKHYS